MEDTSKGEEPKKALVVMLVGAPGSGKSTFCEHVMQTSTRSWTRICQDTIGNGKAGTKSQCLTSASRALRDGKDVFIDRCNLTKEQRVEFLKLGSPQVDVHAVVLDLPAKLCIARSVKRAEHEGNLQGGKAAVVVNRMLQKKELPKLTEGFSRITFCQNENDVEVALNTYRALGPTDTLPNGSFGEKKPDCKVQLGIMKFLKKIEVPPTTRSDANSSKDSAVTQVIEEKVPCDQVSENVSPSSGYVNKEVKDEDMTAGSISDPGSLNDRPTLAFPSISTSDFQFNNEKASDIIVEKVEEFVNKIENARLVLVDLSHTSKILSLVKAKAAQRKIDSNKFFTFVGDITRLNSVRGLRCNVIANAANWRLKSGGGGVNAAIFSAAGSALEVATKEQAGSLLPGHAVVVPLPETSPLFSREGVTHVIHVLGPNMNPKRPNCLNNDYNKGCNVLREAYSSLFEGFAAIVRNPTTLLKGSLTKSFPNSDEKMKRASTSETERSKKWKGFHDEPGPGITNTSNAKENSKNDKAWGSWAQALYQVAMHPEKHENVVVEISDDVVVLNDLYPKAQKHLLVLARSQGLNGLSDVRKEHLQLLRTMHDVGLRWAEKFLSEDASLVFRLGYHSVPSMRQLHLHVISQDFDSKHLKNKKHWNSFTTAFFRDSVDVMEEISNDGKAMLKDDDSLLSMELRCHRCRSAHPNLPRLKSHISNCRASFPANLLENGRLVASK